MLFQLCFELSPFFLFITGSVFLAFYLAKRPPWLIILSFFFLVFGLLLIYAINVAPQILKLNRVSFQLGSAIKGPLYRVAFFSDLHAGALKGQRWVKKIVETVNRENPDLILIGGDFVFKADPRKLMLYLEPLKELKSKEGIYAVLGNHDYGVPGENVSRELEEVLNALGISVLHNQNVALKNFTLVGIDEVWAGKSDLNGAFQGVKDDNPVIALCHNPDIFLSSSYSDGNCTASADLWLLGHTHKGQVRLPFLGPFFLPTETRMEWGFYNTPYGQAFITQGAGESGAKIRFLTTPEVVILDLR